MPLVLKQTVRTNLLGNEVWVTDKTGEYAISVNIGGWGAPNLELNETALLAYVTHIKPTGTVVLTALTHPVAYADTDTNDIVRSIGFTYDGDGHYSSTIFAIPVTLDGITTLAGAVIAEGDHFYMGGDIFVKAAGGANTEVTDFSLLLEDDDLPKTQCDKMFYNKLSIKKNDEYYRDYQAARDGNDPELAADLLKKIKDLEVDIAGADYRFRVGLFTTAENIVAELIEKHAII